MSADRKLPYLKHFIADFAAETALLSAAETGAYVLLRDHYWRVGSLPDDDQVLRRISRMSARAWSKSRATLAELFPGGWRSERIDTALFEARVSHAKQSTNGEAGGKAKALKSQALHIANASVSPADFVANGLASSDPDPDPDLESSSIVPFPRAKVEQTAAAPPERDDDEFLIGKLKGALGDQASLSVVRSGLRRVRAWIRNGCDLEGIVLPELREIAARMRANKSGPLRNFSAGFLRDQTFARRDARLAASAPGDGPGAVAPPFVFVARDTPEWLAWTKFRGKEPPVKTHVADGRRREGWLFPSPWPPNDSQARLSPQRSNA